MLCHLEKESNYERRGCNGITAAPLCQRRQRAAGRTRAALSISTGPLLGLSGFCKEPEGRKLPADWAARLARSCQRPAVAWEDSCPTLPNCGHLMRPIGSAGRAFGAEPGGVHASAQPRTSVALRRSGLEKPQGWAGGIQLWTPPMALLCVLCENSNSPDLSGQFLLHLKNRVLDMDPGNNTNRGTLSCLGVSMRSARFEFPFCKTTGEAGCSARWGNHFLLGSGG